MKMLLIKSLLSSSLSLSLRAVRQVNGLVVRMVLPTWFDHLEESLFL